MYNVIHMIQKWAEELNRHFSKKETQMANTHLKVHSASQVIREMLIKITMRYHITPVRMASIKKNKARKQSENNKYWQGCEEIGTLMHCWWECKMMLILWKTIWRCLRKFKIELPYDLAILLPVYIQKNWRHSLQDLFVHLCL